VTNQDAHLWHTRWEEGRIGFHQEDVNEQLVQYWPDMVPEPTSTVLVPLCGKSRDLTWLKNRGHSVLGIELSSIACRAFFEEQGFSFRLKSAGDHQMYIGEGEADGIRLWCGDLFEVPTALLASVDAWYDRAAIVALSADQQRRYAAWLTDGLRPGTEGLIVAFDYPRGIRNGLPYPVGIQDIQTLFADRSRVQLLEETSLTEGNRWDLPWVNQPVMQITRL
jgi:thiopurine S-methyltransferase